MRGILLALGVLFEHHLLGKCDDEHDDARSIVRAAKDEVEELLQWFER
jgi:hypothetical protein